MKNLFKLVPKKIHLFLFQRSGEEKVLSSFSSGKKIEFDISKQKDLERSFLDYKTLKERCDLLEAQGKREQFRLNKESEGWTERDAAEKEINELYDHTRELYEDLVNRQKTFIRELLPYFKSFKKEYEILTKALEEKIPLINLSYEEHEGYFITLRIPGWEVSEGKKKQKIIKRSIVFHFSSDKSEVNVFGKKNKVINKKVSQR